MTELTIEQKLIKKKRSIYRMNLFVIEYYTYVKRLLKNQCDVYMGCVFFKFSSDLKIQKQVKYF